MPFLSGATPPKKILDLPLLSHMLYILHEIPSGKGGGGGGGLGADRIINLTDYIVL